MGPLSFLSFSELPHTNGMDTNLIYFFLYYLWTLCAFLPTKPNFKHFITNPLHIVHNVGEQRSCLLNFLKIIYLFISRSDQIALITMSGLAGRLSKFWKDYSLPIVMGGIVAGGHLGWRWLQDQEAFVPPGQQKEYPWIEVAKHVKNHEKQKEESN